MKGMDVFVVRFLPFVVYAIVCIQIVNCWLGIDYYPFNLLHSNSAIYASAFFIVSLANRRYHCIWNRAMYIFLIVIPIFNYLDGHFVFFEDVDAYLWVVSATSIFTAIVTAYLAIRHFVTMSKKRMKNGECTEEEIDDLIARTEPRSRGYFREEDFVTADEAMKILCLGQNRNRFFDLIKVYKIESQTFNGVKIGYRREEIHKLKERLAKEK